MWFTSIYICSENEANSGLFVLCALDLLCLCCGDLLSVLTTHGGKWGKRRHEARQGGGAAISQHPFNRWDQTQSRKGYFKNPCISRLHVSKDEINSKTWQINTSRRTWLVSNIANSGVKCLRCLQCYSEITDLSSDMFGCHFEKGRHDSEIFVNTQKLKHSPVFLSCPKQSLHS